MVVVVSKALGVLEAVTDLHFLTKVIGASVNISMPPPTCGFLSRKCCGVQTKMSVDDSDQPQRELHLYLYVHVLLYKSVVEW